MVFSKYFLLFAGLVFSILILVGCEEEEKPSRYEIMTRNWEEVKIPLTISIWIFIACLAKIGFNYYKAVAEMFPDSALIILVGLLIGIVLKAINVDRTIFYLSSTVFFIYILPPMMFDAGYNMPARQFFDNVGACVAFALFNTGFNIFAIGVSLWAISLTNIFSVEVHFLDLMLFGSIIADVDPVAVIVIFEDMHVHDLLYRWYPNPNCKMEKFIKFLFFWFTLYISVFGESVLNDGISVVIYNMLQTFVEIGGSNIIARDYIFGVISFFTIALGGIAVGLLLAYLCAFLTKYTQNVPVLNPVMVFLLPFCSYWVAEYLGFSSILAIVFCGVTLRPYIRDNVNKDAFKAIHYFTKVASMGAETVIFIFLGLSTVSADHHWDTAFIVLSVIFCLIYRAVGIVILCNIFNMFQLKQFTTVDIFIMVFGGLRGAIAYGLAVSLPDDIAARNMYISTIIVEVYFTVFLQGLVLKPIAQFLEVERKHIHEKTMIETVYDNLVDNTMTSMEIVVGKRGHNWMRSMWERVNNSVIRPIFIKKSALKKMDKSNLVRAANKLDARDAARFSHHIQKWYDNVQSRSMSHLDLTEHFPPPNGGVPTAAETPTTEDEYPLTSEFSPMGGHRRADILPEDEPDLEYTYENDGKF